MPEYKPEPEECKDCNGTGIPPNNPEGECGTCGGDGQMGGPLENKRCGICDEQYEDSEMIVWENVGGCFEFCKDCLKEAPKSAWDSTENKPRNKQEFLRWWHESAAEGEPIPEEKWEEEY